MHLSLHSCCVLNLKIDCSGGEITTLEGSKMLDTLIQNNQKQHTQRSEVCQKGDLNSSSLKKDMK